MANIASITIVFHSKNREQFSRLKEMFSQENLEDLEDDLEIGDIYVDNKTDHLLKLYGWSKWNFHEEAMENFLVKNDFSKIEYCYAVEESGLGIFVNSDETGEYINDAFFVEGCYLDSEGDENYFESRTFSNDEYDDVIKELKEWINIDDPEIDSLEKFEKYFNDNHYEDCDYLTMGTFLNS